MTEKSFTVEILPEGTKVRARAGEVLADVLVRAGIPISLYCHQRGVCGKCAVRILNGPLPFPAALEASLLEGRGLGPDHRLACLYVVRGDVTVETLPGSRLERIAVLDTGLPSVADVDPAVKKLTLVLEKPSLYVPTAVADSLRAQLKSPGLVLSLAALSKLGGAALARRGRSRPSSTTTARSSTSSPKMPGRKPSGWPSTWARPRSPPSSSTCGRAGSSTGNRPSTPRAPTAPTSSPASLSPSRIRTTSAA